MTLIPVQINVTAGEPSQVVVQPESVAQSAANIAIAAKSAIQLIMTTLQPLIDDMSALLAVSDKLPQIDAVEEKLSEITAVYAKLSVLQTLYDNLSEFQALYADLAKLLTVHTNIGTITNVEAALSSIAAVEAKLSEIETLATHIDTLTDLHSNLTKLTAIHAKLSELSAIYSSLSTIGAVYLKLSDIAIVEDHISEISAVAASLTNIDTLAGSITQINAVYNYLTELLSLHSNLTALLDVAAALTEVDGVYQALSDVSIVADNVADIQIAATNIAAIIAAPGHADTATTKASEASSSATLAAKYAENPENVEVETGKYSAKHHAIKAEDDAAQTALDRIAVAADKSTTEGYKDTATTQAGIATIKASEAEADAAQTALDRITTGLDVIAAANSEALAEKWAEETEDTEIEAGKYSAKHYATKAESLVSLYEKGYWYGVSIDSAVTSPDCTRIGNLDLHRSLPIHSKVYAFLQNDNGTENYRLNPTDWSQKITGGASKLDGTDGQVMVMLPAFYYKADVDGTKQLWRISEYPLEGYTLSPALAYGAYKASLLRTTNKLSSVKNTTPDYRGGSNTSAWDALANTMLGMPATSLSRTNYRTYARNRGTGWETLFYEAYWKMVVLFTIEYATTNSQKAVNLSLDTNGFKQGGLGNGVTDINSTKWSHFTSYNPIILNGATDSIASGTGEITYTLPFEFDVLPPTFVNAYSAATAYTVGQYTSYNNLLYKCILNSTGNLPTNATYWVLVSLYKGAYNAGTTYLFDDYVSSGSNLYRCIVESTGNAVTNTTYFVAVTRSTQKANRYRGIEMPFGHIWEWCEGVNIRSAANSDADPTHKCYVSNNPAHWNDANYTNYTLMGELPRNDGYIKQMIPGHFMPLSAGVSGTGSATFWCDYFYQSIPASGVSLRGLLLGGAAVDGALAGLGFSFTLYAPSNSVALLGSRLCFKPSA